MESNIPIEVTKLTLATPVYHPVWGKGTISSIARKELKVVFSGCSKIFISGSHIDGEDLITHLYLHPVTVIQQTTP